MIYWYGFIWKYAGGFFAKVKALLGGMYGFVNYTLFTVVINLIPKYWNAIGALFLGYKDAFSYIHNSKKYKKGK